MEPFKNLLSIEACKTISDALVKVHPEFESKRFFQDLKRTLEPLELKQRMLEIARRVDALLPESTEVVFGCLREVSDRKLLSGFLVWPLTQVVVMRGLEDAQRVTLSLETLESLTRIFTSEFAVRPFLIRYESEVLGFLGERVSSPDEHVRRWISEGTRPLLPWGERIPRFKDKPNLTWHLLDALKDDPSRYVQKSVANHINDHSKHHADWVTRRMKDWSQSTTPSREWIVKHGLRGLIKAGDARALALIGVESQKIRVLERRLVKRKLKLGESLTVRLRLKNPERSEQRVVLDHKIGFLKANGSRSPKVFKGKTLLLAPGQTLALELKLPLRHVTTRTYYPGIQTWTLLVNGRSEPTEQFKLFV